MKRVRIALAAVFATVLAMGAGSAFAAHYHHGARVRVFVGGPIGWAWYYPPPAYPYYYPYPPVVVTPASPPTYIEQEQAANESRPQAQASSNYWYYCSKPEGYYPYVRECPQGWQAVPPQPQSQPQSSQ